MAPANHSATPASLVHDRHAPGLGLLIMTTGFMIMTLTDGVAKFLTSEVPAGEIAWGRFFFQSLITLPLVIAISGWRSVVPRQIFGNVMRGLLMAGTTALTFIALKKLPLADFVAIFFIQPFLLTILGAVVEREKVGWRRWLAIVIGFGGALLVIQPSFAEFGLFSLLPVAAAVLFAIFMLLNRRLRGSGSAIAMQTFAGLTGMVSLAILLVGGSIAGVADFTIVIPTLPQWGLLAMMGAIAALGHSLMIVAFRYATPVVLAPTQYSQIISSTIFGFFVFGDFPDLGKWVGIVIIIACGIYVFRRETRVKATAKG